MIKIVGVRFRSAGKVYYFDPKDLELRTGDHVIAETSKGLDFGVISTSTKMVDEEMVQQPLRALVRKATEEDEQKIETLRVREKEALRVCREKVREHELEMKMVNAEYSFDETKVLFYFTADGRVDFRSLVKDLASVFHVRIELRQIGVRDETRMLGGIGICGRELCCATFLRDFQPVSIRMAKEQNLSLNPTKISGTCGRLMCCLKNEEATYEFLNARMPKMGEEAITAEGQIGKVIELDVLRQRVRVLFEEEDTKEVEIFPVEELTFRPKRKDPAQSGKKAKADKGEKSAKADKGESTGKGEKTAKAEKGEFTGKGEKTAKAEKGESTGKGEKAGKTEKGEYAGKSEKSEFTGKSEKTVKAEKAEYAGKGERAVKTEKAEHAGKSERAGKAEKGEFTGKGERTGKSEKGEFTGKGERAGKAEKSEHAGKSERAGKAEKGEKTGKGERNGKGEKTGKSEKTGRTVRDERSAHESGPRPEKRDRAEHAEKSESGSFAARREKPNRPGAAESVEYAEKKDKSGRKRPHRRKFINSPEEAGQSGNDAYGQDQKEERHLFRRHRRYHSKPKTEGKPAGPDRTD